MDERPDEGDDEHHHHRERIEREGRSPPSPAPPRARSRARPGGSALRRADAAWPPGRPGPPATPPPWCGPAAGAPAPCARSAPQRQPRARLRTVPRRGKRGMRPSQRAGVTISETTRCLGFCGFFSSTILMQSIGQARSQARQPCRSRGRPRGCPGSGTAACPGRVRRRAADPDTRPCTGLRTMCDAVTAMPSAIVTTASLMFRRYVPSPIDHPRPAPCADSGLKLRWPSRAAWRLADGSATRRRNATIATAASRTAPSGTAGTPLRERRPSTASCR